MDIIDERLAQAEQQLDYWREQAAAAARQVAMWEGAVEALRGARAALEADAVADETEG